jgi:hypothetical protein
VILRFCNHCGGGRASIASSPLKDPRFSRNSLSPRLARARRKPGALDRMSPKRTRLGQCCGMTPEREARIGGTARGVERGRRADYAERRGRFLTTT